MLSLAIGLGVNMGGNPWSPASLFAGGEQGAWFDPSDFSTMFQDAAGTTPVTATGQPVGLMFDKHSGLAYGSNQVSNPDTGALTPGGTAPPTVVNSTTYLGLPCRSVTFAFNGAASYAVANAVSASDGAETLSGYSIFGYEVSLSRQLAGAEVLTLYQQTPAQAYGTGYNASSSAALVGAWASGRAAGAITSGGTVNWAVYISGTWTGVPVTVYIRAVYIKQLPGNHAAQATTANRPTLQQDASGYYYLSFNGTNSSLATGSIDFTATNKMTAWAGADKLSDAAQGIIAELSATVAGNAGSFNISAPSGAAGNNFAASNGGTAQVAIASAASYASPSSKVLTLQANIGAPSVELDINGVSAASAATTQGTGNYGNYPLYIGARGGTTLLYTGRIYQLIARGAASTAAQLASANRYVGSRMGISL